MVIEVEDRKPEDDAEGTDDRVCQKPNTFFCFFQIEKIT